jgi:hypothetical protein
VRVFLPGVALTLVASLVLAAGTAAAPRTDETVILAGLARAVAAGHMPASDAAGDRSLTRRASGLWPRLPAARATPLRDVLDDVAAQASRFDGPRARALFGMLAANVAYLGSRSPTGVVHQDITDANGVVYRWFPGHGFQFHPLGNFAALNAAVGSGDEERIRRLADALAARGVPTSSGALVWEYYFSFGGGPPPWTSGMAQAVAAQSFARAASALDDSSLADVARRAERAIPGRLDRATSFGDWVRLYSFSNTVVLNAQLQTALSLATYAQLENDSGAAALAARLRTAAANGLSSFDTGFWSLYALPAEDSTLDYHTYVVQLLTALAKTDTRFAPAAKRFASYMKQPPAFQLGDSGGNGVLFWLSKPSRVSVTIGGGTRSLWLSAGWHRTSLPVGTKPGAFVARLTATDYAGNRASVNALPVVNAALAAAASRTVAAPAAVAAPPSFAVGTGLDDPGQAYTALKAGFDTIRLTVPWQPGESAPPADVVAALNSVTSGHLVVRLAYDSPDVTLAPFAASLVQAVPRIEALVVGDPRQFVAAQDPTTYVATLGAVRDAIRATGSTAAVVGAVADTASIKPLGVQFAASGRDRPIMDELAISSPTQPSWDKVVAALGAAFDGGPQAGSALPLLWIDAGTATKVPRTKAALYAADAAAAPGATERAQADAYISALKQAACRPTVAGVLLDRLADGSALGAQDGLLYPDGTAKGSLSLLAPPLAQARRGVLAVCPGLAAQVAPTALVFPDATSYPATTRNWFVGLACSRDCLYLLTLDRASTGVPMLARRGSLTGGRPAATIVLPTLRVPAGTYRFTVRLVSRINPGPLSVQHGPTFTVAG